MVLGCSGFVALNSQIHGHQLSSSRGERDGGLPGTGADSGYIARHDLSKITMWERISAGWARWASVITSLLAPNDSRPTVPIHTRLMWAESERPMGADWVA